MKLTRVTITGADDGVNPVDLANLSNEYPFVEWGILRSSKRTGGPRYPSDGWRYNLIEMADPWGAERMQLSMHLCGKLARLVMQGCDHPDLFGKDRARRVQLNGFSDYILPGFYMAEKYAFEFILQCNTMEAIERVGLLRNESSFDNITALWDLSGGEGWDDWSVLPMPGFCGYAGGITEHNVVEKIHDVLTGNEIPALIDSTFWIDLESGARTDDKFDLDKVARILELAKPFVVPTGDAA